MIVERTDGRAKVTWRRHGVLGSRPRDVTLLKHRCPIEPPDKMRHRPRPTGSASTKHLLPQTPRPARFPQIFSQVNNVMGRAPYEFSLGESRANRTSIAAAARYWAGHCTKSGQRLVDRLHSIACKADRVPRFSLTLQIGRVKKHSFFGTF